MHAIDLERIGIEHHHAEVGLGAGDDPGLHAQRCAVTGRIERGNRTASRPAARRSGAIDASDRRFHV